MLKQRNGRNGTLRVVESGDPVVAGGLMSPRQAIAITGMTKSTFYDAVHAGIFRSRRLPGGRGVLVARCDVETFIRGVERAS